mgnify:CR=1 FL=1
MVVPDGELEDHDLQMILTEARKLGVLGDGRSLDVLRETAGEDGIMQAGGNRLNPMSDRSILTASGVIAVMQSAWKSFTDQTCLSLFSMSASISSTVIPHKSRAANP